MIDRFVKPLVLPSFGSGFIFTGIADVAVMHHALLLSKAVSLVYVICTTATRDVFDDKSTDTMVHCIGEKVKLFVRVNAYEFKTSLLEVMDISFEKYKRGNYEYLMLARNRSRQAITSA